MPDLRVLHLGKYYPPAAGGIETHLQTLARAQASLGAKVQVFCMQHMSAATATEQDGLVQVTRYHAGTSFYKLEWSGDLIRDLREPAADIIHLHVPNPTMLLALRMAKPRVPIIVTYHSDVIRQKVLGALFRPVERFVFKRVQAIFVTSPHYAAGSRFLQSYMNLVRVLPLGLDLAPYLEPSVAACKQAAELRVQYPTPIWLSCGRLVYYKGLQNAVRALAKVPGSLVLVGEGPERDSLETEVQRAGVTGRVHFVGRLPKFQDLIPYYLAAEALWFPSNARSEAFGLVQVEAMASGCPVINTQIPSSGVPWVCRHEESGLTVPINDPNALASAAMRIFENPGLRRALSKGAIERARSIFSDIPMAKSCIELYRKVLEK